MTSVVLNSEQIYIVEMTSKESRNQRSPKTSPATCSLVHEKELSAKDDPIYSVQDVVVVRGQPPKGGLLVLLVLLLVECKSWVSNP